MKQLLFILVLFTGISMISSAQNNQSIISDINNAFDSVEGDFAIAFYDFSDGEKILINEKEVFHAASTMKTPVMIEVFKQAEKGKFNLQDSITVKNEFKSIVDSSLYSMDISVDSGDNLYEYINKKRTIYQLIDVMITVSSNLATNILIDMVSAKNVMETMKALGANDIQVLRGVEDLKAFHLGRNNTTTAYDLMLIFKAIENQEILSEESCKEMLEILKRQEFNNLIPKHLPEGTVVAHKTGSITGVSHDSGIVYTPSGKKYVLVILGKNIAEHERGEHIEAEVSKLIFDYVENK